MFYHLAYFRCDVFNMQLNLVAIYVYTGLCCHLTYSQNIRTERCGAPPSTTKFHEFIAFMVFVLEFFLLLSSVIFKTATRCEVYAANNNKNVRANKILFGSLDYSKTQILHVQRLAFVNLFSSCSIAHFVCCQDFVVYFN